MKKSPCKVRWDKDNPYIRDPYWPSTVFLEFQDSQGNMQFMEINKELYETFDSFELEDLSALNKRNVTMAVLWTLIQ